MWCSMPALFWLLWRSPSISRSPISPPPRHKRVSRRSPEAASPRRGRSLSQSPSRSLSRSRSPPVRSRRSESVDSRGY